MNPLPAQRIKSFSFNVSFVPLPDSATASTSLLVFGAGSVGQLALGLQHLQDVSEPVSHPYAFGLVVDVRSYAF